MIFCLYFLLFSLFKLSWKQSRLYLPHGIIMRTSDSSLLQSAVKQGLVLSFARLWEPAFWALNPGPWGGGSHTATPMLWKAPGVCILAPMCPVSVFQVDSWALGVLLYTLIYGTMPFDGFDHKNLIRQISSGEYREPTQPSGVCPTEVGSQGESIWFICPRSHSFWIYRTSPDVLHSSFMTVPWKAGFLGLPGCPCEMFRESQEPFLFLHSVKTWQANSLP